MFNPPPAHGNTDSPTQRLSVHPAGRAASVRFIPSNTAANDKRRRLWLAFFAADGKPPKLTAEKSVRTLPAAGWRQSSPRHGNSSRAFVESLRVQKPWPLVSQG